MTPFKTFAVLGTLVMACAASSLSADVLVEETFNYPDGNLSGKSGGTGFSGNWSFGTNGTGTVTVTNDAAVISGGNTTWATRYINPVSSPSFYFSYNISGSETTAVTSRSFLDVLVFKSGSSTLFQTGMYYDTYGLRLRATAGGVDTNLTTAATTTLDTVYTVVGKLTFNDGAGNAVLSIWINPTDESSPATYTQSWLSSPTSISQLVLQRYDSYVIGAGSSTMFDDIRIGTDWTSVSSIPEPSTAAAFAGAAGLVLAAMKRR